MMDFHQIMDRERWEEVFSHQRERAELLTGWLNGMQIQAGDHILDLGAGPGYFSLQLAHRVGPTGKIYAIDQAAAAIAFLTEQIQQQHINNIIMVISDIRTFTPPTTISAALLAMVIHHDENPPELLARITEFLPAQSSLVIAEFHPDGPGLGGPPREHRIAPTQLTQWLEQAGLTEVSYERQTAEHYMLTARRKQR